MQRFAGLPQREVERCALERPAPVVDRDLALRRAGEESETLEQLGERGDRVLPGEIEYRPGVLEGDMIERVINDVLADPLVPAAS